MSLLTRRFAGKGIAPEELIRTIWKGVGAMAAHDGSRTNEAVFWDCFERSLSAKRKDVETELLDFYSDEFNKEIRTTQPTPLADEIITTYENSHSSKPNVLYFKEILVNADWSRQSA